MAIQFDTLRVCLSTFCFTFLGIRTRFDRNSWKSESANRKENNSEGEFSFLNVMLYKVEQQSCTCGTSSGWKFVFAPPALPWWVLGFHQGSPAAPGASLAQLCPVPWARQGLHCHLHGVGKARASLHLPWPFNLHFIYFILVQQKESVGFWWRGWLLILL